MWSDLVIGLKLCPRLPKIAQDCQGSPKIAQGPGPAQDCPRLSRFGSAKRQSQQRTCMHEWNQDSSIKEARGKVLAVVHVTATQDGGDIDKILSYKMAQSRPFRASLRICESSDLCHCSLE